MFFHVFTYKIKYMLRDRSAVFWLILFPILMSLFFYMAFSNLNSNSTFEKIDIAIVGVESENQTFFDAVKGSEMFVINNTNLSDAKDMLSEGTISAIVNVDDGVNLIVGKNGINESITKFFFDTYQKTSNAITTIAMQNPSILQTDFINQIGHSSSYTKEIPINGKNNAMVVFFYALLSMACLMGCTLAINDVENIQANQSPHAARINISPIHKMKIFLATVSASIIFHTLVIFADIFFISNVLGVDFGEDTGLILLVCFVGCFSGIMFGSLISSLIKLGNGFKTAILIGVTMFEVFLAGMMSVDIKYIIAENFPILAYINPANLITDALYALYYYPTKDRFYTNLYILSGFGIVCAVLTYFVLRRQKYASI